MAEFKKAAFVGAGLIGNGLALNCIMHGVPAVLQTRSKVDLCRSRLAEGLDFFEQNNVITHEERLKAESLATITTSVEEAVTGADFIQESGPDKMELKHALIEQIESYAAPDAIIATSTSSKSITEVFENAKLPGRCMGGHPYLPAYLIPIIEVTKGQKTEDAYVAKAKDFYSQIGKEPVVLNKEVIGFICNRFQSAIHREVVDLVENGVCSVEDADKAMVYSVGLRWSVMGQFLTLHMGVGEGGIGKFNEKYGVDPTKPDGRLSNMPTWTTFPADWCEKAAPGVEEEIAHRSEAEGRDTASIAQWRDKMLLETLRLHGKM
ncbi:MAG: 3-hydroxyacyl-CoA dehydrogenase NAD-binding domain-containing protein [Oscillospiraceae bacterium]|nr:3-hydroxyacyl-CoA dehydrogenase family protein [Oscillospiraceae bacterium]MCC8156952.1 3-hydroxyacyl-CoA dehydrogenase family protein [Oscillospiraceae bacterium]MCD7743514.1 3-hydroxyacyl-CoA dehydrogenase NAD-binding domain-containing protein [Oscillospiraceae bacterium]MCD7786530.1 3-hydroxyacyl-CoA dehydrogenase NAD-binding domain-containing protein [Oscillospiraceae bacterium]MCD7852862.1 3-hydroxyacyl-CoA dehydrogenase NAD-binding domain-containing protein [Oscillospiraceae bacterium]